MKSEGRYGTAFGRGVKWMLWILAWWAGIGMVSAGEVKRLATQLVNDSLRIDFWLDVQEYRLSPARSYTFTPLLRGQGYLRELPPIVLTGARRYRFDRREEHLTVHTKAPVVPYVRYVGREASRTDSIHYVYTLPYEEAMNGASFVLMRESKDCCELKLMGLDMVAANVMRPGENSSREDQASKSCTPCIPCIPMVSYLPPKLERVKFRSRKAVIRIDYPVNRYDVYPGYLNNVRELQKLDSLMPDEDLAVIRSVDIRGYASPEGPYEHNVMLASSRAGKFADYMVEKYALPRSIFTVEWTPEDWEGLEELLKRNRPPHYEEALDIIRQYGVFEGRESQLMSLRGGTVYNRMKKEEFVWLRRIVVKINYDVRGVTNEEAAELLHTDPSMLSLQEMYRLAWIYGPGTDSYREVYEIAARQYPDDPVANINAASAVIMSGDFRQAHRYLDHLKDDFRAWNDLGVLAMMEGDREAAEKWFRKALDVEPQRALENLNKLMGDGTE